VFQLVYDEIIMNTTHFGLLLIVGSFHCVRIYYCEASSLLPFVYINFQTFVFSF
jgi:hypothetical protein